MNDKIALLKLALELVNRIGADGFELSFPIVDGAPRVVVRLASAVVGSGTLEGVLVDDVHVELEGLTFDDLANPGPQLLERVRVKIHHVAVRISRDWLNAALSKDPKMRELGVESATLVFPETDTRKMVVRVSRPPFSFEVQILFGLRGNQLTITVGGIQLMGFLPVPAFVTNLVFSFIESKVRRPGLSMEGSTVLVDVLRAAPLPVPVELTFRHFETRGRYLLVEMGASTR